jgi:hypothetical protein
MWLKSPISLWFSVPIQCQLTVILLSYHNSILCFLHPEKQARTHLLSLTPQANQEENTCTKKPKAVKQYTVEEETSLGRLRLHRPGDTHSVLRSTRRPTVHPGQDPPAASPWALSYKSLRSQQAGRRYPREGLSLACCAALSSALQQYFLRLPDPCLPS